MSPWTEGGHGLHAPTLWRALITVNLLGLVVTLFVIPRLFAVNHEAVQQTHALAGETHRLTCRLGGFFVGQPVVRRPEQSARQFAAIVAKAEVFLRSLKAQGCAGVGGVTTTKINTALHKLHGAKGGGTTSGTSPPTSPGGGSHSAPPAPRQPPSPPSPPEGGGGPQVCTPTPLPRICLPGVPLSHP